MLKIEIFADCAQVETKVIPANEKRGAVTIYHQRVYCYFGGKFPEECFFPVADTNSGYPAGVYTLAPTSFTRDNFNNLDLNRFNLSLIPLPEAKK